MNKKEIHCLIIDDMHPSIEFLLENIGVVPHYRPDIQKEEFLKILPNYQGLIVRSKFFIDEPIIQAATQLKFIGRAGAGLDNLDVTALTKRNITLLNAPEGNRDALAEQLIAMLLGLMNNLRKADQEVRQNIWDREGNRGYELMGKTVGIIGYGYMGQATAKRLAAFGCKIIAYDKYKNNFGNEFVKEVTMDTLVDEVDILSIHIPLTAETKYLVNDEFLQKFKKKIWFVNTARGEIVSLRAINNALESGKIRGAALDVLENEKINKLTPEQQIEFNKLKENPKAILTPHIAGWTFESYYKINETLVQKINEILPKL